MKLILDPGGHRPGRARRRGRGGWRLRPQLPGAARPRHALDPRRGEADRADQAGPRRRGRSAAWTTRGKPPSGWPRSRSGCRSGPGNAGRLFGSVSPSDIADAVKAAGGPELDRRRIEIKTPDQDRRRAPGHGPAAPPTSARRWTSRSSAPDFRRTPDRRYPAGCWLVPPASGVSGASAVSEPPAAGIAGQPLCQPGVEVGDHGPEHGQALRHRRVLGASRCGPGRPQPARRLPRRAGPAGRRQSNSCSNPRLDGP